MTRRVGSLSCTCVALLSLAYGTPDSLAQEPASGGSPPLADYAGSEDPPLFESSEQAVAAFKDTVGGGDVAKLAALLGLDAARIKASEAVMATYKDIQAGVREKVLVKDVEGLKVIEIGNKLWPLPFPLVQGSDKKWSFDTFKGLEEIANRNVGGNELQALTTVRAYLEAQENYASQDHDGDGVLEYAQKLISSDGQQDGLYWPADAWGGVESPAGEGLDDGSTLNQREPDQGYFGYRYQILTGQGPNIVGGEFDYVINGNMIAGFALVAWPVDYGISGVKTLVVNRNGVVYEADLGAETAKIASAIRTFNPGDDWDVVAD